MIKHSDSLTAKGVVDANGQILLDHPLPLEPGPVEVEVRRATAPQGKRLTYRDIAGTAKGLFAGMDVDAWLRELRDEWDRKLD